MSQSARRRLTLTAAIALGAVPGSTAASVAASSQPNSAPRHLYVSMTGSNRAPCARAHPCRTITHATKVAHPGDVIDVEPGTYREEVRLTKRLTIRGFHSPVIDAQRHGRGIFIEGGRAAGSVIQGLTIEHATYEGILALGTERITIAGNVVRHNDRGFFGRELTGECKANGKPPKANSKPPKAGVLDERAGGCGEAIHIASTSDSRVLRNQVTDNTGGIYLTDESGPAAHNLIADNRVVNNVYDCGITLASHSRRTVTAKGRPRSRIGGVYDNTIRGNVADGNGLRIQGAGILVAAAFAGGAAYDNRIIGNTVMGNGLPGITLHSHKGRQDLNGTVIRDNVIGRNAVGGPGDYDAGIHHTAGIVVWSAVVKITRLQVSGNRISDNHFGIWTENAPRLKRSANDYRDVAVPLSQH